ncbi:MAG: hypothetical protein LBI48_06405 [Burkholderiaceae bacterium]|nr:hypothetical protein [Burkholderiaceae bacterium]
MRAHLPGGRQTAGFFTCRRRLWLACAILLAGCAAPAPKARRRWRIWRAWR